MTSSQQAPKSVSVLGYPIQLGSKESLIDTALSSREHCHVVTLNPEMIMAGEKNPSFGEILKSANLGLADGAGAVWALKWKGYQQSRIPGIEFAEALLAKIAKDDLGSVGFLGGYEGIAHQAAEALQERYPRLRVSEIQHGFFKDGEEAKTIAERFANKSPRLMLVGLGVPRQEEWIAQYKSLFKQPCIFIGVGGSFDVWSGNLRRAPKWICRLQLEWLWRFSLQPWRIQRSTGPILEFIWKVLNEKKRWPPQ